MDRWRLARIEYQMKSDFDANMVGMASLRDSINTVKKAVEALGESVEEMGARAGHFESTTRAYYEHMIQGFSELRKEHEGLDARVTRLEEGPS